MAVTRFGTPSFVQNHTGTGNIGVAGNDRLVLILPFRENGGTPETVSTCTVDGKSATFQTSALENPGAWSTNECWAIHETQLGASNGNVTIAITTSGIDNQWGFGVLVFYGVGQRDAASTYNNNGSSSASISLIGINASIGDLVVMAAAHDDETVAWSTWTSPLSEQLDTTWNPMGFWDGRAGIADAILDSALSGATLTATAASSQTRLVAIGGVWAAASGAQTIESTVGMTLVSGLIDEGAATLDAAVDTAAGAGSAATGIGTFESAAALTGAAAEGGVASTRSDLTAVLAARPLAAADAQAAAETAFAAAVSANLEQTTQSSFQADAAMAGAMSLAVATSGGASGSGTPQRRILRVGARAGAVKAPADGRTARIHPDRQD